MAMDPSDSSRGRPWEEREVDSAAAEAARIGGSAGDENLDPAERPLVEAGEGVAEGFELAEEELVEAAESADERADPGRNPFAREVEDSEPTAVYSEADREESSESLEGDR
jgi:hypothetical protein